MPPPRLSPRWLFRHDDRRGPAARLASVARQSRAFVRLPPRVAVFYLRALFLAWRLDDRFTVEVMIRPVDLRALIDATEGATRVAEIGTASGCSAIALALSSPGRTIFTFDPVDRPTRLRYLELVDAGTRARIHYHATGGEDAPEVGPVDAVFDDGSHERDLILKTVARWRERLAPGGRMLFHDYGDPAYPGVAQAIEELGLQGRRVGNLFVWTSPAS